MIIRLQKNMVVNKPYVIKLISREEGGFVAFLCGFRMFLYFDKTHWTKEATTLNFLKSGPTKKNQIM